MASYEHLPSSSVKISEKKFLTADKAINGIGKLLKYLPTGTVFAFQVLNPVFTNNGSCQPVNEFFTGVLLVLCAFSACFSTFIDSYVGSDGEVHYGIATTTGLWPSPFSSSVDLASYKLRFRDFVHSFITLVVFAVVSLLDSNTIKCYYPSFASHDKWVVMLLPPVVGFLASVVYFIFPNKRHGIGNPVSP